MDCVSVSVILGLGLGTLLTLLCVVCHVIAAFDHWILTITLSKILRTTYGARSFHPSDHIICCPSFVLCVGSRLLLFLFSYSLMHDHVIVFLY
jgi:hypothetical protein